jgi:hypothetical protein
VGEAMWLKISAIHVTIASFLAAAAIAGCSGASAAADGHAAITPALKCEALAGLGFPSSTIVIEKAEAVPEMPAGTVQVRPPDPETVRVPIPSNCRAEGVIDRRIGADGKNYAIGFAIALPDRWNGRFLFQGGGGLNGSIRPPLGAQATGDIPALARGFAVVSTDSGHRGAVFDASFMADQEAALNFAYASVGKVTAAAKAIIARYYGEPPARSYFVGCSTGGREGMLASQRYPAEYDGIVAGAPAMRTGRSNLGLAWANYNFTQIAPKGESGKPDPAKAFSPSDRKLVTDAIVAVCDAKDGLKDGMIFNTRQLPVRSGLARVPRRQDRCLPRCGSSERSDQGLRRPEEFARRRVLFAVPMGQRHRRHGRSDPRHSHHRSAQPGQSRSLRDDQRR